MRSWNRQSGQGLIEYMLIVAVVTIALLIFLTTYPDKANDAINTMNDSIQTSVDSVSQ